MPILWFFLKVHFQNGIQVVVFVILNDVRGFRIGCGWTYLQILYTYINILEKLQFTFVLMKHNDLRHL